MPEVPLSEPEPLARPCCGLTGSLSAASASGCWTAAPGGPVTVTQTQSPHLAGSLVTRLHARPGSLSLDSLATVTQTHNHCEYHDDSLQVQDNENV